MGAPQTNAMTDWNLEAVRRQLAQTQLDGWLLADFRGSNPLAAEAAGLEHTGTRRWFLWLPRTGAATLLIHAIEESTFRGFNSALQARRVTYVSWSDLRAALARLLADASRIAMEYSPDNAIPYLDCVTAGAKELVEAAGQVEVVGSAELAQRFQGVINAELADTHYAAVPKVMRAKDDAFALVAQALQAQERIDEYRVQERIVQQLHGMALDTEHRPIVAVNGNAANPHYEPTRAQCAPIRRGDMLLIDLWGKERRPGASCFVDVTWTAYCGAAAPPKVDAVFQAAREARDACIDFIRTELQAGRPVQARQADDACRDVIAAHGYGAHFIHRTGHSLGTELHARGANLDNLETQDHRCLIPGSLFTVEPGIYLPDFDFDDSGRGLGLGIRTEVNCLAQERDVQVTTPLQARVIPLLA